ncbi:DUF92 domain-containing protein [Halorubrum sp. DTA98]|uniref:DUF92 domain-containing protein n=1 Tax=Halorubrum sp. DTA98 TaxID=3402163 RepID=UPI003AAAE782
MNRRLRRASVFAAVAALAVITPVLGEAAVVPYLVVAGAVFFGLREGPWFETLALPGDRDDGRLYGIVAFTLAIGGLALFASVPREPLPYGAFAAAALAVGAGRFGRELVRRRSDAEFPLVTGYLVVGATAAVIGQLLVAVQLAPTIVGGDGFESLVAGLPSFVFLASVAVLTAALVRSLVYDRDAHITVVIVAFVTWAFTALDPTVTVVGIAGALAVTVALGYVSYALGTASVPGMLTGVLLSLLAVVLGGVGWFLTLIAFYAVGGLASKYRFDEKTERGVAQENQGARGTGNVLANSAVALVALVGYAATDHVDVPAALFGFAFAGAIATALADTLSSEIGGLYDGPRLITTLKPVDPGTDGAVTWQGEVAGVVGGLVVAAIAAVGMPLGDPAVAGAIVVAAGVVGMTADSLLGALIEGDRIGNQAVNFLATLSGAIAAIAIAAVVM